MHISLTPELEARIKAVLRRSDRSTSADAEPVKQDEPETITFDGLKLDIAAAKLYDREGAEAEPVFAAARPGEQDAKGIGEDQLGPDERRHVVAGSPIPAPVRQHCDLTQRLDVVLLPQRDHESRRTR